ncbi:hypothetical protein [Pseudonocardia endophytica]|uniref:hypothetical protein n=1 Tax=Pseudonocardia endophytica TaxID=401976 RepID=UPI00104A0546|nr:hypothetical protein [Pseudonocardia endophytica]
MPREEPDEPPFPWQGAPGYSGFDPDRFPPHAPMPGAPPYPAGTEPERGPVANRTPGAPSVPAVLPRCLVAAGLWVLVALVLAVVTGVVSWPLRAAALALPFVITTAVLVVPARRGARPGMLVLVAFAIFWVLHAVAVALLG